MGKTSQFTHEVLNEKTGKIHHFRSNGWISYDKDLICGVWSEQSHSFKCNRAKLLACKTLDEVLKLIKHPIVTKGGK